MEDVVVYDVEVIRGPNQVKDGWENPQEMGFATGVVYSYENDTYHFFEGEAGRLALVALLDDKLVVSFNGIKFDSKVLLGNNRELVDDTWTKGQSGSFPLNRDADKNIFTGADFVSEVGWNNFDILMEYLRARFQIGTVAEAEKKLGEQRIHDGSFSLDGLAAGTLGMAKTGHGARAPILYAQKRFAELYEYNLHDVRLTKKLFEAILCHKKVTDRQGRVVKIEFIRQ